jgi:putative transposase
MRTRSCAGTPTGRYEPTGEWIVQRARNLVLAPGERFKDIRFLIRDRGSNFTGSFDAFFQAAGARILRTAVKAPQMNAICERLVGALRRELPGRVIPGEGHPRAALTEYQVYYNTALPHQGSASASPTADPTLAASQLPTSTADGSSGNPSWVA